MFSFSMKDSLLAALKARRFQVADDVSIPDSRGSHTR